MKRIGHGWENKVFGFAKIRGTEITTERIFRLKVTFSEFKDTFARELLKSDKKHSHAKVLAASDLTRALFRLINGKIVVEYEDTIDASAVYVELDDVAKLVWKTLSLLRESKTLII